VQGGRQASPMAQQRPGQPAKARRPTRDVRLKRDDPPEREVREAREVPTAQARSRETMRAHRTNRRRRSERARSARVASARVASAQRAMACSHASAAGRAAAVFHSIQIQSIRIQSIPTRSIPTRSIRPMSRRDCHGWAFPREPAAAIPPSWCPLGGRGPADQPASAGRSAIRRQRVVSGIRTKLSPESHPRPKTSSATAVVLRDASRAAAPASPRSIAAVRRAGARRRSTPARRTRGSAPAPAPSRMR
jgi:hypothetical protein